MILPNTVLPSPAPHGGLPTIGAAYLIGFFVAISIFVLAMIAIARKVLRQHHVSDQPARLNWGSDVVSLRTACGAGWQVVATSSGAPGSDSLRAYEFPDRDPVPVSAAVEFAATVTALWTEAKGDTAIAVTRNSERGSYEAFRVAVACNQ